MTSKLLLAMALLPYLALAADKPAPAPVDPATEYASRAEKLGDKNPKGWLELANFCEEHLLWDKRTEALRKVLDLDPAQAEAHARLDEAKSGNDWMPVGDAEAKEAGEKQAKGLVYYGTKWVPAKEAEKLREADRKVVGWNMETRLDTPHLTLYSGRPLVFARQLAGLLENEVGTYQRIYGKVWKADPKAKPIRVYLFGDRETFERIGGPPHGGHVPAYVGGFYANATQILYVGMFQGGESNEDSILSIAAHEVLHGIDDLFSHAIVRTTPQWIREGRAEHFRYAVLGRQVLPGFLTEQARGKLRLVFGGGTAEIPMADLLQAEGGFTEVHYVNALALVHFLFHGEGGKHAAGFRAYLSGLPAKDSLGDFEKVVGKVSDLEPAFRRYIKEVLLAV